MITKSKSGIKISRKEWENMRNNPVFSDTIELLEDIADYKSAKNTKGKDLTVEQYLEKRGLLNNH
jgi:hypothetical protein